VSLASVTTAPSAGAGPLKITVAVTPLPPVTSAGLTVIAAMVPGCPAGGTTSSLVVATPAGEAAVRKTGVGAATAAVVTGKAFPLFPGRMVIWSGTDATAGLLLANVMSS